MTREEAIEKLELLRQKVDEETYRALIMGIKALEQEPKKLTCTLEDFKRFATENNYAILTTELYSKAITALEQEPCDDAISREAVLNLIEKGECLSNGAVKKLPSVQPSRKGHWEERSKREYYAYWERYKCSKCGHYGDNDYKFCPNCGACMKGGAE